jgi:hypothetical protein
MSGRFSVACAFAAVPERVTSCSRLFITNALRASITRMLSSMTGGLNSLSTRPRASVSLVIRYGFKR